LRRFALIAKPIVGMTGVALIGLGVLFWTGRAINLVPLHMGLGFLLVALLFTLALMGLRAGAARGLVVIALLWTVITPLFGMYQTRMLIGELHWIIRILHLGVGLAAMGMAETLAKQIARVPGRADARLNAA
jgi:hypothetical protein